MSEYQFSLMGVALTALPSGALWMPDSATLVVSDLHLCKSDRQARKGQAMLPPYETRDTLSRLDADIMATAPKRVVCLGDSFDDIEAIEAMRDPEKLWLARMQAGRSWVWIAGNHDAGPIELGGDYLDEVNIGPLTLRHIALDGAVGEISGHYHPKYAILSQSRPAFLYDSRRLILPAYGTYTGGMPATRPPLRDLFQDLAIAIVTGPRCIAVPLERKHSLQT